MVLSREDLGFLLLHDPQGVMHDALATLGELHDAECIQQVYDDEDITVYSLRALGSNKGFLLEILERASAPWRRRALL